MTQETGSRKWEPAEEGYAAKAERGRENSENKQKYVVK